MLNPITEVNTIYQVPHHTQTHAPGGKPSVKCVNEAIYWYWAKVQLSTWSKDSIGLLKRETIQASNLPSFSFSPEANPLARIKTPACLFPLVWTSEQFLARMRLNVKLPRLSHLQHLLEEVCGDYFAILPKQLLYARGGVEVESTQSSLTPGLISLH